VRSAVLPTHAPPRPVLRYCAKVSFHCTFDVVWCTQYRAPVLDTDIAERLKVLIGDVVTHKNAWLVRADVTPACVHLVLEVSPQLGVHRLVKAIKAHSARVLRTEFPSLRSRLPSLWTNAYLVATTGRQPPSVQIQSFIAQQPTR
jgi:putative transposase